MISIPILAVDDNKGDLFLFEETIEIIQDFFAEKDLIIDFKVTTAEDGDDALEKIKKSIFDIYFVDLKMPKMDGIELLKEINKLKEDSTIRNKPYIVIFTTSDYDTDIKETFDLGANAYLLKNLDLMEFEENLKSVLLLFIQDNFVYFNSIKNKYKNVLK